MVVPDLAAVALGPTLGVLVYLGLLRVSPLLDAEDQRRFAVIGQSLRGHSARRLPGSSRASEPS